MDNTCKDDQIISQTVLLRIAQRHKGLSLVLPRDGNCGLCCRFACFPLARLWKHALIGYPDAQGSRKETIKDSLRDEKPNWNRPERWRPELFMKRRQRPCLHGARVRILPARTGAARFLNGRGRDIKSS